MKKIAKKTLGEMIGEMLQAEELNADQMQIIDMLCQINESDEITSNTAYYVNNNRVDEFEDFVVENAEEIWAAFNACKTLDKNSEITKLVLLKYLKVMLSDVAVIVSGLIVLFFLFDWIPNGVMYVLGYKSNKLTNKNIGDKESE